MAQSAITVTPPNPTPPTNFSFVGATPPTDPAQAQAGAAQSMLVFAPKVAVAGTAGYSSVDAEGKGTEVAVTQTYSASVFNPAGPLITVSDLGNYTGLSPTANGVNTSTPNQQHA